MKNIRTRFTSLMVATAASCFTPVVHAVDNDYSGEQVFELRPKSNAPRNLGHIGPTGILAHIEQGVKVTVEGVRKGSPAEGKFKAGEAILAVNGKSLKGHNPYVVLGTAITTAEASDGKMVFDLDSKTGERKVTVMIPILGAYSPNWPIDCPKSKKIISNAAAFYHDALGKKADLGIPGALSCLFLLSTGDDTHLPVVKKHYQKFIDNPKSIGNHTWNNGYNGITCAEYYLRTGDKDMLPVLQAICDDARDRQNFNSAWKHWGADINPGYVWGGLMNPASAQVLTSLLLCKEAGVNVDETTLLNALRYFYRFVGHGTVPYGDHRGEGGLASNGKDAMIAVAMQVAAGASGDTSIYQDARDYLSKSTLDGYSGMVMGHGDHGRGDGIWRGIVSTYLMEKEPTQFRVVMNATAWWYDLSRFDDGALGLATCQTFNKPGSGAAAAMTYTAPMKTLRITGAPRSKYAKEFKLPAQLWGTEADLAFHRIKPVKNHEKYGKPMPARQIVKLLGSGYGKGTADLDPGSVALEQLLYHVRHSNYLIRAEAAKALCDKGEMKIIEQLLQDPDPRLRRAALDGILDWNYFFAKGKQQFQPERFTPKMIELITAMLTDPKESQYVVEGALFAISCMPAEVIKQHTEAIRPWTKHVDWWFRDSSFTALQAMESDPALYLKVVPVLTEMMITENHTMPRQRMNETLARSLKKFSPSSAIGLLLVEGFNKAVAETQVLDAPRAREGKYNINHAIGQAAKMAPETAPQLATLLVERGLSELDVNELLGLVSGGRGFEGFLKLSGRLKGSARKSLEDVLYDHYRPEISKRLKASGGTDIKTIDAVLGIIQLRNKKAGWQIIGAPQRKERNWQYTTFDPTAKKDVLPKRNGRRFRVVDTPSNMEDWFKPEFETTGWKSGKSPIGRGKHPKVGRPRENRSVWGEGEILFARTTFELEDNDFDMYRLRILCGQGFIVYLNGERIRQFTWWANPSGFAKWPMDSKQAALLKKGTNTIAVYTMCSYPSAVKPHWKEKIYGKLDCYIEGLRKEDLY